MSRDFLRVGHSQPMHLSFSSFGFVANRSQRFLAFLCAPGLGAPHCGPGGQHGGGPGKDGGNSCTFSHVAAASASS